MEHASQSLWSDAFDRLKKNRLAVISGLVLIVLLVLAIFAPWIAPHSYAYQNLELGAVGQVALIGLVQIP